MPSKWPLHFFGRFDITLPSDIGKPEIKQDTLGDEANDLEIAQPVPTQQQMPKPSQNRALAPQGISITASWLGETGTGTLKFDKQAGEGSMVLDMASRHCEGIWRHKAGQYQTSQLPFGDWYVFCDDGLSARGFYTSENPVSVRGEGKDDHQQALYFKSAN